MKYFLVIEVARFKQGLFIFQLNYDLNLIGKIGILGCKACDIPLEQNHTLYEDLEGVLVDKGRYQHLLGRLIYLSHTGSNIAYFVSVVSQFIHALSISYGIMDVVYHILQHLK